MTPSTTFLATIVTLCVATIVLMRTAFNKGKPTCRHYLFNTYLYVFTSLALVGLFVQLMDRYQAINPYSYGLVKQMGIGWVIVLLLASIAVLLITMSVSPTQPILKHSWWVILVFFLSIIFYPMYHLSRHLNLFYSTLLTVAIMMGLLTTIAFIRPEWISLKIGPVLLMALLIGIILHLALIFSGTAWNRGGLAKWLAWFMVLLFSIFILYDTKRIQVLAKACRSAKDADYVNNSLAFLLDLINLFNSLVRGQALS